MASANESLIDFDSSDSLDKLTTSLPNKADTISNVSVSHKPVRSVKVSHIRIESKRNELAFSLYASINKESKAIEAIRKRCQGEGEVELKLLRQVSMK